MKNYEMISMQGLQLFADGGAAGGSAAGAGAGDAGVNASAAGVQTGVKGNQTGEPDPDGAPAAEAQNPTGQPIAADLNAEFEALIKGKYKEQYNAKVKDTVQKRLKGPSEAAEKYKNLSPALEMLAKKYGVDASNTEALIAAISDDDSFYEEEAFERNMTVPQLKEFKKVERENAVLRRQQEERDRQQAGQRQYEIWLKQAESAKVRYPNLDLATEIQNPKFLDLLRSNVDVEAAYKVIHMDDIVSGAMEAAVRTAADKVSKSVAANAVRPSENGSGQGAATVKTDVSKLNRKDIDEVIRRVARGERVSFG